MSSTAVASTDDALSRRKVDMPAVVSVCAAIVEVDGVV